MNLQVEKLYIQRNKIILKYVWSQTLQQPYHYITNPPTPWPYINTPWAIFTVYLPHLMECKSINFFLSRRD